jgi:hypothetical protein
MASHLRQENFSRTSSMTFAERGERLTDKLEPDRFRLNHLASTATWQLKRESCSTSWI